MKFFFVIANVELVSRILNKNLVSRNLNRLLLDSILLYTVTAMVINKKEEELVKTGGDM